MNEQQYERREELVRDGIRLPTEQDLTRMRGIEDLLLENDLITFAGVTKTLPENGKTVYKIVVGTQRKFAHLMPALLDATLKRVQWAEDEDVAMDAIVVCGRVRNRAERKRRKS